MISTAKQPKQLSKSRSREQVLPKFVTCRGHGGLKGFVLAEFRGNLGSKQNLSHDLNGWMGRERKKIIWNDESENRLR